MESDSGLEASLLEVSIVRYAAFFERFGRPPGPHDPLLFDPAKDEPTAASPDEQALQVMSAAIIRKIDPQAILAYLGLNRQLS